MRDAVAHVMMTSNPSPATARHSAGLFRMLVSPSGKSVFLNVWIICLPNAMFAVGRRL